MRQEAKLGDATDLRDTIPGVHWLNVLPADLLTDDEKRALRDLGARVEDHDRLTEVRLAEAPSLLTDNLVADCMQALTRLLPAGARSIPADWWRRPGPGVF